jgi:hypothetical protein
MSSQDKSKTPLDPKTDNANMNSEINAATTIQSSVTPEDYPVAERATQAAIVGKDISANRKPTEDTAP